MVSTTSLAAGLVAKLVLGFPGIPERFLLVVGNVVIFSFVRDFLFGANEVH